MPRGGLGADSTLRARRWDVLILGSALPGLAAGIRLAMAGHRVLVAEEDVTAASPKLLQEPFALPGILGGGVLDAALQAFGIPMIERRRFEPRTIAYQVLLPEARLDVGDRDLTARELVAWGLAKPDDARALTHELERAAGAVRTHLLETPMLGRGSRRALSRAGEGQALGLPDAVTQAEGELADFFDLQLRGLSELGASRPCPEASTRLLGSALSGGTGFGSDEGGLIGLLKKRLEALHAEFRTIGCPFEFVELGQHPGILRAGPGDVWLGRAVIVNAPGPRLAAALRGWDKPVPGFLEGPAPEWQRVSLHLRALREVVPEALEPRALLSPALGGLTSGPIRLALHPSPRGGRFAELIASAVAPAGTPRESVAEALEAEVRHLMPFSEQRLKAGPLPDEPEWDAPSAVADPSAGSGWPSPIVIRSRSREPVASLPRDAVAALGIEGEILLGWQAGDALREELA
ncbi:MAG: hypothetical protein CL910_11020 [Deltaproteobacteria bacterium]|jgi:hypothetical protein|nr:hypothetical protein [Deltaproteobacteria bacterium]